MAGCFGRSREDRCRERELDRYTDGLKEVAPRDIKKHIADRHAAARAAIFGTIENFDRWLAGRSPAYSRRQS